MLQRKTKKALLNEYKAINKEHPLADTIQSILDMSSLTNEGKLKFIQITLQMRTASDKIAELLRAS